MHTYDITLALTADLPLWPGDSPFLLEQVEKVENGEGANVSRVSMSVHMGTHVDAPHHFLDNGKTVDKLPLNLLIGRAYVLSLPGVELITASILEKADLPPRIRRILFKTRNSDAWANREKGFRTNFVALSPDAAEYLINRGVRLVGVDYLSVAPFTDSRPTHEILLKGGVVILEGLDLSVVTPGRYTLYCLPLKLVGSDGAPARAILVGV
jgi:arylformamidase